MYFILFCLIIFFIILCILISFVSCRKINSNPKSNSNSNSNKIPKSKNNNKNLFNETDYKNNIYIIDYVYDLYKKSLKKSVSMKTIEKELKKKFGIINVKLLLSNMFIQSFQYMTVIGLIGQYENTKEGILCFRGTQGTIEWIGDAENMKMISLSEQSPNLTEAGQTPMFAYLSPSAFASNSDIGIGWYNFYTTIPGAITKNNCICKSECKDGNCKIIPKENISKIDKMTECSSSSACDIIFHCDSCKSNTTQQNVSQQIVNYIQEHPDVKKYSITGHSLGGALSTVSAIHIAKLFGPQKIKCIYTYASPKVGNQTFANEYNNLLEKKTFRIANTKDIVPKLPDNFSKTNPYVHVGNDNYTFTWSKQGYNIANYHSLVDDYIKNFDSIKTN